MFALNLSATQKFEIRSRALLALASYKVVRPRGHYDYGNGFHGPFWLDEDQLLRDPHRMLELAQDLMQLMPKLGQAEVIVGLDGLAASLAFFIANTIDGSSYARVNDSRVAVESGLVDLHEPESEDSTKFQVRRVYREHVLPGKKVAIVDFAYNTGYTMYRMIELMESFDAKVSCTGVLYDCGNVKPRFKLPPTLRPVSLAEYSTQDCVMSPASDCWQCKLNEKLTNPYVDKNDDFLPRKIVVNVNCEA